MRTTQGDLIKLARAGEFDVIVHGCNCFCAMGAGIALAIKRAFPEAYEADQKTPCGDRTKLGTCSAALCANDGKALVVVNAYTQFHWDGEGVLLHYEALRSCMWWIKTNYSGKRIGLPKIGAGLARGDWSVIRKIIDEELYGEDVTIVEFSP